MLKRKYQEGACGRATVDVESSSALWPGARVNILGEISCNGEDREENEHTWDNLNIYLGHIESRATVVIPAVKLAKVRIRA